MQGKSWRRHGAGNAHSTGSRRALHPVVTAYCCTPSFCQARSTMKYRHRRLAKPHTARGDGAPPTMHWRQSAPIDHVRGEHRHLTQGVRQHTFVYEPLHEATFAADSAASDRSNHLPDTPSGREM